MCIFFFFNDTATTEIYTLSLHDALPISLSVDAEIERLLLHALEPDKVALAVAAYAQAEREADGLQRQWQLRVDRKSTRLNSSHLVISYAVFCLKKKKHKRRVCTHLSLGV